MAYQTIISVTDLKENLDNRNWVIVDCRYDLQDQEQGFQDYLKGHVPGAVYANLDKDLSSEVIPGKTGRHPLPVIENLTKKLSDWRIDNATQVVAYDCRGGGFAARLWWLLRWLGHDKAAVLDGGWPAWIKGGGVSEEGEISKQPRVFSAQLHPEIIADVEYVEMIRQDPDYLLLDSRSSERYWGLNETSDPIAGHIAGAVTAPYAVNLDEDDLFIPTDQLKERFENLLEGIPPENVVFYCGSGITAAHNILSMVEAGYEMPKLYPGSWSEWILDTDREIGP